VSRVTSAFFRRRHRDIGFAAHQSRDAMVGHRPRFGRGGLQWDGLKGDNSNFRRADAHASVYNAGAQTKAVMARGIDGPEWSPVEGDSEGTE
jgi:hypothetical protein